MKLFGTIVGALLIVLGALWILQGANIVGGSAMSGQSQWLYIGIVVAVIGAGLVWFVQRRRV